MKNTFWILTPVRMTLLALSLFLSPLYARHHGGRFDASETPCQEETTAESEHPDKAETRQGEAVAPHTSDNVVLFPQRTIDGINDGTGEDANEIPTTREIFFEGNAPTNAPHSPLGSICNNFSRRCSFVADHLMNTSPQKTNQQMLKLFSRVLSLMTNLADTDLENLSEGVTIAVRADEYVCNLIEIVSTIRETISLDPSLADIVYRYPVLGSLMRSVTPYGRENLDNAQTEIGMLTYYLMRTPSSGKTLVQELFNELRDIAQTKADYLMALFHADLGKLFDLAETPVDDTDLKRAPEQVNAEERKEMRQAAMLCRAAASACESIANVVTQDQYLAHSKPLMTQFNAMLSTMAITYDRLGASHRLLPRTDRNLLAHHLAEMISLIPTTRAYHRRDLSHTNTTYIDRCNALKSVEEQEAFVQHQLDTRYDRSEMLGEFFSVFRDTVGSSISLFSHALSDYTNTTLTQRYWGHLSESTGE